MAKIIMRYPNLRYGNPAEFEYYALGIPDIDLAKQLRRTVQTIRAWRDGSQKIPFWVPELLRLRRMEHNQRMQQMRIATNPQRFGTVSAAGELVAFSPRLVAPASPDKIVAFKQVGKL